MEETQDSLGLHMLAEYYQCNSDLINNLEYLEEHLLESARIAGATIVTSSFHPFSPVGISGIVVVKESHFAIHTWPEYDYAAVDFFTCSDRLSFQKAYDYLTQKLQSQKHSYKVVKRGEKKIIGSMTEIS